ncbi:hypothetical protein GCM10018793_29750 [Streptomyces sulfonofaciens]|uniref:OmpR/PhoB-type domain-containing protein n=1 Tax=Streptomyces sulfonofaciens TaxID=68272 RepID=A0A919G5T7_9ACTN|nr:BTAD domain-containing putative transcriptional regulator [Streptomyces sulfonofaciens]GHH78668.1 hypothetical protein GCM10018793_29750 [Streptomyces sulfonofaciens]
MMSSASGEPRSRTAAPSLRFSVLGPVRAWRDDEQVSTGSPQQRALLAALLLQRGRSSTAAELVDAMWGQEPPAQSLAALRTYASRLRKALGTDALVSAAGGYALRLPPGALDLQVVDELGASAEKSRLAGDMRSARALFQQALAHWEGEPLSGVPGPFAATHRVRLEEKRLQLLEARLEADLEIGDHRTAAGELTALTAVHPLRERLRSLLMTALYRSGRQAEALAVYEDTRRLLTDELGVEPGAELQQLHQRILQADPVLAAAVEPSAARRHPGPGVPGQLPAPVADFTGRAQERARLRQTLLEARRDRMPVAVVSGLPGVGKTALAVRVAQDLRAEFPDGQLYGRLGPDGARSPGRVLAGFLRAFGTSDSDIPDDVEERAALWRSTLVGRRVLVLLDDAADMEQVVPLLPGEAGCAVLLTSRSPLSGAGTRLLALDVLTHEESVDLFTSVAGRERTAGEAAAVRDVVRACGHLPLAICLAASRFAARPSWNVADLASLLQDGRSTELRMGSLVERVLRTAHRALPPAEAHAFVQLGRLADPVFSVEHGAAVLRVPDEEAERLLEALVHSSLLGSPAPGRYAYHPLVGRYARELAERVGRPEGGGQTGAGAEGRPASSAARTSGPSSR